MEKEWDTVELLRHSRHDWLNKIQLIKGNLTLGKIDRIKEIIDEIVYHTEQESKLSNLPFPYLASFLLTYNWCSPPIVLNFEVLNQGEVKNVSDEEITSWLKQFINILESTVDEWSSNFLTVTIDANEEWIRFIFDFNGILKEKEPIQQFLEENKKYITHFEQDTQSFILEARLH